MNYLDKKEKNRRRKNLLILQNGVRHLWSQNLISTWLDVYNKLGFASQYVDTNYPDKKGMKVTFPELRDFLTQMASDLEVQLDKPIEERVVTEDINAKAGDIIAHHADNETHIQTTNERVEQAIQTLGKEEYKEVIKETMADAQTNENDYGLHPASVERAIRYWFQVKAIKEVWQKLVVEKKTGVLLLAGTGTGKTYIECGTLRRLLDINYHEGKVFTPIPYLVITRTTVVEKTKRTHKQLYDITPSEFVEIINIEQLRSKAGRFWVKEEMKIVNGEEETFFRWKPFMNPCVVFFDESQAAKNVDSTQSKIMYAYNDLKANAQLVSISATPFTRVSEAKCFAVSTHRSLDHLGFPQGTVLTNDNWPEYSKMIAAPSAPDAYNEAAIERLMKDLEPWVVRVKGVIPQFDANNNVEIIHFATPEEKKFYNYAWLRFLERKRKAKEEVKEGRNMIFVLLQQFSIAAEMCRAPTLAKRMYDAVTKGVENYDDIHHKEKLLAAVCAVKWKCTMIKIVTILIEEYGISRDNISLVWGGGQTQLTAKQKAKNRISELADELASQGLDAAELLKDTGLDEVEDRTLLDIPEAYRLGEQSMAERQMEIDRFQRGESHYCLFTFKAGGVGLSLHHCDEMTDKWDETAPGYAEWRAKIDALPESQRPLPGKVRRKKSGYAVEEDIPFIPVRERINFLAPTYSAIELVQGLGRCPRLTSLSNTTQKLLFYGGTIEDDIAVIVSQKLRCLSKVVKMPNEKWQDVVVGNRTAREAMSTTSGMKDDEKGTMIEEGDIEE